MKAISRVLLVAAVSVAALIGCKEGTLGPELRGSIHGQVVDFETGEALAGAGVTTAPPTFAIVTDDDGRFELDDIPDGNYTITARKKNYRPSTVTVSVRENRITPAVLFLEPGEDDGPTPTDHRLEVQVLNWQNQFQGDSTFVHVEYRARNTGETPISHYDVTFRIETDGPTYFEQRSGGPLQVGQFEIRNFERYIFDHTATHVAVDTFWIAP